MFFEGLERWVAFLLVFVGFSKAWYVGLLWRAIMWDLVRLWLIHCFATVVCHLFVVASRDQWTSSD